MKKEEQKQLKLSREFCILNTDIFLNKNFNLCHSDMCLAIMVALLRVNTGTKANQFVYSNNYILDNFKISRNNSIARTNIDDAVFSLRNYFEPVDFLSKAFSIIQIKDEVQEKPFVKVYYDVYDKIFNYKTKTNKYKLLMLYLNIIKHFSKKHEYSFVANHTLMDECGIKSEKTLAAMQDILTKDLGLFIMKQINISKRNFFIIKNFYGYNMESINQGIQQYMNDNPEYIVIDKEIDFTKRSEKMKIEHLIRKGFITPEEGQRRKNNL